MWRLVGKKDLHLLNSVVNEEVAGHQFIEVQKRQNPKTGRKGEMMGYHRYSFRLTDAETDVVVWEDDYEFKKTGRRGTAYR